MAKFVAVAVGLNIVVLILSYVEKELFGMPLFVVSAIMIARNITRSLMAWARTDSP